MCVFVCVHLCGFVCVCIYQPIQHTLLYVYKCMHAKTFIEMYKKYIYMIIFISRRTRSALKPQPWKTEDPISRWYSKCTAKRRQQSRH